MKTNNPKLTKSIFLQFLQCTEYANKSFAKTTEVDEVQKQIFQNGIDVGLLARQLNEEGEDVESGRNVTEQINYLLESIQKENKTYFEAPFSKNNLFAKIDILIKSADGTLVIREVKSTTSYKEDEHLPDLYFQKKVIEEATRLKVSKLELVHINNDYVFDGEWKVNDYFKIIDVPINKNIQKKIYKKIDECLKYLALGFPEYKPGPHCKKPYLCPHFEICNSRFGTILNLRRGSGKSWAFIDQGINNISEIKDVSLLSIFQLKQFEAEKTGKPVIDFAQLKKFLDGIMYKCSFLDFEGFSTPIIHDLGLLNIKPYSQIIFQAELKISNSMDDLNLQEYGIIAIPGVDPRKQVADFLFRYVPDSGSVVVYFKNYEVTRIKELIWLFPEYRGKFLSILERIVDLEEVFSKGIYVDKNFQGSSSVKKVLGVVCEDLATAYEELPTINNGQLANIKYLQHFKGLLTKSESIIVLEALKQYCSLDVYSLWKIINQLRRICEKV